MRTERITKSTSELDNEEMTWWNANAGTIEKIWAQNESFQKIVRQPYLERMKNFFVKGAPPPVLILEIGCGTGWVCRMVADEYFHVIGTDFSEGQLAIAREMATKTGKDKYLKYELADASTFEKKVDGVVIHALLHHLSSDELEKFFSEFAKLRKGTKIFMYEPVFFEKNAIPSFRDKAINKLVHLLKSYAIGRAKKIGKGDRELNEALNSIFENATRNGWYISPKEVPFYDGELEKMVGPYCTLQKKYVVNRTDLEIAQNMTMNGIDEPDRFSRILLSIAGRLDKYATSGNFAAFLYEFQHLFVCYELIKN